MKLGTTTLCGMVAGAALAVAGLPGLPRTATAVSGIIPRCILGVETSAPDSQRLPAVEPGILPGGLALPLRRTRLRAAASRCAQARLPDHFALDGLRRLSRLDPTAMEPLRLRRQAQDGLAAGLHSRPV
jgi:hypothetical protein